MLEFSFALSLLGLGFVPFRAMTAGAHFWVINSRFPFPAAAFACFLFHISFGF